jgi:hypothetical protein
MPAEVHAMKCVTLFCRVLTFRIVDSYRMFWLGCDLEICQSSLQSVLLDFVDHPGCV